MAIDQDKLRKIAAIAERPGSDGEALVALRKLNEMLAAAGTSLTQALAAGTAGLGPAPLKGVKPGSGAFGDWADIFGQAMGSGAFGDAAARARQAAERPAPQEVTLMAGELPRRFCARFEILHTGATKLGKTMANVKLTLSRTPDDVLRNVTRVAFANAFGGLAESLADLESELCEMTAEPSRKPYPDTLTSAVCAKASGASAWANA